MTIQLSLHHRFAQLNLSLDATLGAGVTAIFGPSGAGKTSVLRIVAGLLTPERGHISIGDRVLLDTERGINTPTAKRRIGYVFQEPRLFPHLNVDANLRYGQSRGTGGPVLGFDALVQLLGLEDLLIRRPATLSGGEGQRVALGRALLSGPDLLLMDEPLSALDDARKAELLPYFERLRDQARIPILYVSHDVSEVGRLADIVILLDRGQTRAIGPAADVFAGGETADPTSRGIAGGLLSVTIAAHDLTDGLTEARMGAQSLWLPGHIGAVGDTLRLRIDARDVMLMRNVPDGISALNILPARITNIGTGPRSGALIRLEHQGQSLVARITKRSLRTLDLQTGQPIFAVIKSMSVLRAQMSRR